MAVNQDLIREFRKITRYDLDAYLSTILQFTSVNYKEIQDFYSGTSQQVPSESLRILYLLVKESKHLDHIIDLNKKRFSRTDFWDLLEILEDIKSKLVTTTNISKWYRVSTTLERRVNIPEKQVSLSQGQTIESLVSSLGSTNEQQDWYQTAIRNDKKEEDYTSSGGITLNVPTNSNLSSKVQSIVDTIDRETLKGKDVFRKITWENDDLKVVVSDEAFLQSCDILLNLVKRDNPEFTFEGLDMNIAAGQNLNSISYPILVRQLTDNFNRDDTISSFSILGISREQDGIFIEMQIKSKSNEDYNISTTF